MLIKYLCLNINLEIKRIGTIYRRTIDLDMYFVQRKKTSLSTGG